LRNGHRPYGDCSRKQPLVPTAPCQRSHSPSHRKRNGILPSYEGYPSPSTLDPRFWQRMRTPVPGHLRHPRNRQIFTTLKNIPEDRKITYGKIVCDYKPPKQEKERVCLTVGGDRLDFSGDVATSTADITTFKILINSTLSTKDAAMMMMDIKNYYFQVALWSTRHCVVSYRGSVGTTHSPGSTSQGNSPTYGSASLARVNDEVNCRHLSLEIVAGQRSWNMVLSQDNIS
jgi:hypothetical protein